MSTRCGGAGGSGKGLQAIDETAPSRVENGYGRSESLLRETEPAPTSTPPVRTLLPWRAIAEPIRALLQLFPQHTATERSGKKERSVKRDMVGGRDAMNLIRDNIYLGSARAESGPLEDLQNAGITHVVQVGTGDFMSPTHDHALSYCCIRALDFEGENLLLGLKEAKAHSFMDEGIAGGGKVLVHCFAGISRSATTVLSYLMAREGLSFEEALVDLIRHRNCVAPNRGFCDQLRILQDQCQGRLEEYTAEMLSDNKDEMTNKQWLALLLRTREKAYGPGAEGQPNGDLWSKQVGLSLVGFKERLAEREQLAREGKYVGEAPPAVDVADGLTDADRAVGPAGPGEEYGLGLT